VNGCCGDVDAAVNGCHGDETSPVPRRRHRDSVGRDDELVVDSRRNEEQEDEDEDWRISGRLPPISPRRNSKHHDDDDRSDQPRAPESYRRLTEDEQELGLATDRHQPNGSAGKLAPIGQLEPLNAAAAGLSMNVFHLP